MCDSCGCEHPPHSLPTGQAGPLVKGGGKDVKTVEINQSLLKANEDAAAHNREHFDSSGIFALNLISSPGSGKTTLLEKTAEALKDEFSLGVLEGDIETDLDAERIRKKGVPAVQLTTGGACHLDSALIHKGMHELEHQLHGKKMDILFIENVGNLVCPSFFNLGEHIRVVLVSVPEGPDKPIKYPKAFKTSHVFIITKSDLLPHFDFDIERVKKDALSLNPELKIIVISATTGEGMGEWFTFLRNKLK
ncbi:MAG: hydrogenase nickel incorporation protein HypB [Nitrospirae bacterium]|nr:hydrogenase nickel incorporation protein HypB [Nitrospirota bacterium]